MICWGVSAYAQGIISQKGFMTLTPVYQSWSFDTGSDFSEFTVPVFIYYPINRNLSFSLRGNQSRASGDNLETLNGLTDTQFGINYFQEMLVFVGTIVSIVKAFLTTKATFFPVAQAIWKTPA